MASSTGIVHPPSDGANGELSMVFLPIQACFTSAGHGGKVIVTGDALECGPWSRPLSRASLPTWAVVDLCGRLVRDPRFRNTGSMERQPRASETRRNASFVAHLITCARSIYIYVAQVIRKSRSATARKLESGTMGR